jgi:carboxylesterase type B
MWQANAYIPIGKYSGSAPFSLTAWKHDIATSRPPPGLLETMNDNVSEDCLFLDVHVRKENFELANSANPKKKAAPVLVWVSLTPRLSSKLVSC